MIEWRNFNLWRQQPVGETFDEFLTDLKELVKTFNHCDTCRDSLVQDWIIVGLRDGDIVEKVLAKFDLILKDAIDLGRVEEAACS